MEELVPVILVIIILVAWIVILGPSLIKRRARSGGDQSITHFHYQLRVLEHSAPEPLVAPAYRLRAVDGTGSPTGITYPDTGTRPVLTVVGAKELPRPALAFLGEPDQSISTVAMETEQFGATHGDWSRVNMPRVGAARPSGDANRWEASTPSGPIAGTSSPGDGFARAQARRRRRDTLAVLAGTLIVALVVSLITGSAGLWVLTALDAVALGAYVAVLVRLRRQAHERELKLHYLDLSDEARPARVGGPPSYVSGRYAHPSNWQAAAR